MTINSVGKSMATPGQQTTRTLDPAPGVLLPDFILYSEDRIESLSLKDLKLFLFNRANAKYASSASGIHHSYYQSELLHFERNANELGIHVHGEVFYLNAGSSSPSSNPRPDQATLLAAYLKKGDAFVKDIKGPFSIIIVDASRNSVKIFSDQLHPKTIYYFYQNKQLVVSSSLTSIIRLLQSKNTCLRADKQAILEYFLFDYTIGHKTFIHDIQETGPGQIIEFIDGKTSIGTHFNVLEDLDLTGPSLSANSSLELIKGIFRQNIRAYDRGPDVTAVPITGGYDTRCILAGLGDHYRHYQFYSYGRENSWDITIPRQIAHRLQLDYTPIVFDRDFDDAFIENGETAMMLSDGVGTLGLGNYVYVYSNFFSEKRYILSGLFGSELIKRFAGANLVLSENMLQILLSSSFDAALESQARTASSSHFFQDGFMSAYIKDISQAIRSHPLINNNLPQNMKIFAHFLSFGARTYFQKELKIQSPWVAHLHPFFDIDFIKALLKTPFSSLHNFGLKKSLVKNIKAHKIYSALIDQKPELAGIISTHGFKPKHLRHGLCYPLIALDYYRFKRRIANDSGMTYQLLIDKTINYHLHDIKISRDSIFHKMIKEADQKHPKFIVMFSLFHWLKMHSIEV